MVRQSKFTIAFSSSDRLSRVFESILGRDGLAAFFETH